MMMHLIFYKAKLKKTFPLSATVEEHISDAYQTIRETNMVKAGGTKSSRRMRRYIVLAFCMVFLASTIIYAALEGGIADRSSRIKRYGIVSDVTYSGSYQTSPEHQAAAEWEDYVQEVWKNDEMYKIDSAASFEKYGALNTIYEVVTDEMEEKLYSIADKWGLRLHEDRIFYETYEELLGKMQIDSFIPEAKDRAVCVDFASPTIYGYPDGSFLYSHQTYCEDNLVGFQFRCTAKGVLDTVGLSVDDVSEYEEWVYTNAYGDEVLLSYTKEKGIIMYETDDFWIIVNVMAYYSDENLRKLEEKMEGQPVPAPELSKDTLEKLADIFSFQALE